MAKFRKRPVVIKAVQCRTNPFTVRWVDGEWRGMGWPRAGERLAELEWTLRYGTPTRSDILSAASYLAAYWQMVHDPARKRNAVCSALRAAERSR